MLHCSFCNHPVNDIHFTKRVNHIAIYWHSATSGKQHLVCNALNIKGFVKAVSISSAIRHGYTFTYRSLNVVSPPLYITLLYLTLSLSYLSPSLFLPVLFYFLQFPLCLYVPDLSPFLSPSLSLSRSFSLSCSHFLSLSLSFLLFFLPMS